MFIKRKDWEQLSSRIDELELKTRALLDNAMVNSFYYGEVTFPEYVKLTEKEIHQMKSSPKNE